MESATRKSKTTLNNKQEHDIQLSKSFNNLCQADDTKRIVLNMIMIKMYKIKIKKL